jgi:hypothetical protein
MDPSLPRAVVALVIILSRREARLNCAFCSSLSDA